MKAAVYRHFSASGELLYVGYTANPMLRTQAHSSQAAWFGEVAKITIEWHATREEAYSAEIAAIKRECPRENIKDMPDDLFRRRSVKKKWEPPHQSAKSHSQLDALERAYKMNPGCWYYREAGLDLNRTNEIRESGRELLASEVIGLKNALQTTYKMLEQIGIHRRNQG